jgi:glycine/D-amino acid oxidase-like deaminating enzyme
MPDVIVIGGGVVGTAAALELARAGAQVTVLERGALASGASGASNGLVAPPTEPELEPLWRASAAAYRELSEQTEARFALDPGDIGTLIVATTPEQVAELATASAVEAQFLDADGVRAAEPNLSALVLGGLLLAEGWRVHAATLTAAQAAAATAAGADIRTGVEVRRLEAVPDGCAVVTDTGTLHAGRVLLAAGAWTRRLAGWLGHDLAVRPVRGWLAVTAPGPPLLRRIVIEADWQLPNGPSPDGGITVEELGSGAIPDTGARPAHRLIAHQAAGGGVLLGGSQSAGLHDGAESASALEQIAARACQLVPAVRTREVMATWSGLRPASADGLPYIDRLDEHVSVCAGHGSQGILTGAGSARLAVDLMLGRPPLTDPRPFRLGRPIA